MTINKSSRYIYFYYKFPLLLFFISFLFIAIIILVAFYPPYSGNHEVLRLLKIENDQVIREESETGDLTILNVC